MPVRTQSHMEGSLDGGHRADKPEVHGIAGAADNLKAARFRESNQRVPIFLAGSEPRGKLLGREELMVRTAGRIVDLLHKSLQPCAITQSQNNVEVYCLCRRELPNQRGLTVDNGVAHMAR